jgi:hypothetical protein
LFSRAYIAQDTGSSADITFRGSLVISTFYH